jgi:hypothetical protein
MQEIYNHRFVIVHKINGVGPKDPGCYDIAVRYKNGTTFVVEASSEREDALDVASELASAFDSWSDRTVIQSGPQPEPPMHGALWLGPLVPPDASEMAGALSVGSALIRSADMLWSAVSEDCPVDEVIDHVSDLLRGCLPAELVDTVIEWADVNECSLAESVAALRHQAEIDAEVAR